MCEQEELTAIKTSNEPRLYWKNCFHKNPLWFKVYPDFEADNEIDICNIGKK